MKINIRENSVEIEGYVNAIERNSQPLMSRIGKFIERICKGAFGRAISRNNNIRILLNHDELRDLGGTADGNLELEEDAIGLHARATITDAEVVEKAKRGDLVGWSFGFYDVDVDNKIENGMVLRLVKDLDLTEVSLLDRTRVPAYEGTLVSVRDVDGKAQIQFRGEPMIEEPEIREETPTEDPAPTETPAENAQENCKKEENICYNEVENIIKEMKGA